jgi:uncharacterized protein YuzE
MEPPNRVLDPEGREVVFDAGTRLHLALGRPKLMNEVELVLGVVANPDHHENDPLPRPRAVLPAGPRRTTVAESRRRLQRDSGLGRDRLRPAQRPTEVDDMNVTIAGITFDHHHYDARGDVLYLNVGEPRAEATGYETPESHAIHYDDAGAVIGLTLLNVRWILEREGKITLTWPEGQAAAATLDPLLVAA